MSTPKLPKHVSDAVDNYIKYRYSHLDPTDRYKREKGTKDALIAKGADAQEEYVEKVNAFLETNKDVIAASKEATKNSEYQKRIKDVMSRNLTN